MRALLIFIVAVCLRGVAFGEVGDRASMGEHSYSVNSCRALTGAIRCGSSDAELHKTAQQICKLNRSDHESAEQGVTRETACIALQIANSRATCAICVPLLAKADHKNEPGVPHTSEVPRPGKVDRPDRINPDTAPQCAGSESCQRRAEEENRRAAEEARRRRLAFAESMREARNSRLSTISSATNILNNWKKSMDENPRTTPAERQRYQADLQLFNQANASLQKAGDITFTDDDSKKVSDPGLREDLSLFAEARDLERDVGREDKRTEQDIRQFESLAAQNRSRAEALGAAPGARAPAFAAQAGGNVPTIAVAGGNAAASSAGNGARSTDPENAGERNAKSSGKAGSAPAQISKSDGGKDKAPVYRSTLRDTIRKRLAAGGKDIKGVDKDALQADSFDKVLGDAPLVRKEKTDRDALFESVVAEASQWSKAGVQSRDGNVAPFMEAMERDLASATGMLGMETASLFERVRSAHRSCQARDCVNSLNP